MSGAEVHMLAGAYALDAVTDLERAAFARHLAHCPTCAREVAGFRETAAKLGMAVATGSSTRLRSRVLTEIAETRQLAPAPEIASAERRSWRTRVVIAVAAIAAAATLVAGIGIGALRPDPAPSAQLAVPAAAPDASVVRASGAGGCSVVVYFSRLRGEAAITARSLPALGAGRAYQLWVIGPRGAQSVGLLHAESGTLTAALPADADRVAVTTEPAAGSPQPTTPAVVRVPLA
ncbi:anti-sigma factor domain-containing protein [Amycolatopsis sp. cg5]|uniref:anti-sigma factor n=1 Tax=Amycolatopsis sp. cg5 TaxID=3238802 RepID=UPI0035253A1D